MTGRYLNSVLEKDHPASYREGEILGEVAAGAVAEVELCAGNAEEDDPCTGTDDRAATGVTPRALPENCGSETMALSGFSRCT